VEFAERTIRIILDEVLCKTCATHACVAACARFDRGILELVDGRPGVTRSPAELKRLGTECLACEHACRMRGNGALRIEALIPGLDEYRRAHGTTV
jgi:hypothetical protein